VASPRTVLRIYADRQALPHAKQTMAALACLPAHPSRESP